MFFVPNRDRIFHPLNQRTMSRMFASKCCGSPNLRHCSSLFAPRPLAPTTTATASFAQQSQSQPQPPKRWAHTVRLIAMEDLPHGKAYKGDVVTVKAGYARNHLVPQKLALYATPQNFSKLGIVDPDFETEEERIARLQRESNMTAAEDRYLKDSDLLKKYLRNKVVSCVVGCVWLCLVALLFCFAENCNVSFLKTRNAPL